MSVKLAVLVLTVTLVAGCITTDFRPYIGQRFQEWKYQAEFGTFNVADLVQDEGEMQVWTVGTGIYYHFRKGILVKETGAAGLRKRSQNDQVGVTREH